MGIQNSTQKCLKSNVTYVGQSRIALQMLALFSGREPRRFSHVKCVTSTGSVQYVLLWNALIWLGMETGNEANELSFISCICIYMYQLHVSFNIG